MSPTYPAREELLANQSDPDDGDYDDTASNPKPQKRKHRSSEKIRPQKRRKHSGYGSSDMASGSDEIESDSTEGSFVDQQAHSGKTVQLTASGRVQRNAAKKALDNFDDPSNSEDEHDRIQDPSPEPTSRIGGSRVSRAMSSEAPRPSRIVKLKVQSGRSRVGGKGPVTAQGRRSSRIAHDDVEPLMSLTGSGRHAQVERPGSADPEQTSKPQTRADKRLSDTSAIIEASQENSSRSRLDEPIHFEDAQDSDFDVDNTEEGQENQGGTQLSFEPTRGEEIVIAESQHMVEDEGNDEEEPISKPRTRLLRGNASRKEEVQTRTSGRLKRKPDQSSDFDPADAEEAEEEIMSNSESSPRKGNSRSGGSSNGRKSRRLTKKRKITNSSGSDEDDELDGDELAEEAAELGQSRRRPRRRAERNEIVYEDRPKRNVRASQPDYRVYRPEVAAVADEDDNAPVATLRGGRRAGPAYRSLFSTFGPFGGAGGPRPMFAGPEGTGAAAGADSDSSDDDLLPKAPRGFGGTVGMTPTSAFPQPFALPQTHNTDPAQGASGGPANLGRIGKDKKALADVDPLGIDQSVSFEGVGGLDDHINQLKEMVALPLLYPEVFQQFKVTPPRGVLFHGPPGTGKTLLARALAASVSTSGRKVTFYMRKGADALSKWVGEAERQLRLLFEEARKNQPSIIFFDEIDGLAPVRSSKQEQIHASIVATLLALMDGMDGRGQVIVIGATNRPDSVDPALRRPGRFDREFYFPLPNAIARRAIIDIHTKEWEPPLKPEFKTRLADITKGFGGADLRALCTESALNAVQGTYPQIYKSNEKLVIDPTKIKVLAKDFMISVNRMIPSSERSAPTGAAPLDTSVEPLLRESLQQISKVLDDVLPGKKKPTALEEAEFDDRDDERGFDKEMMQQNFDRARIYRPRLLIQGLQGMGQQYLAGALLNRFERLFVQSFDMSVLYGDATRSPEAAVVQLFNEVRRHKPSVVYIPNVNNWYETVGRSVTKLLSGLLRSLPPNEPVLLLGIMELEGENDKPDDNMMRELFGYSSKNSFRLGKPREAGRHEFFRRIMDMIGKSPKELPDGDDRKRRDLPTLEIAPMPTAPTGPSKDDLKAQKKADRKALNLLKISIQPIMDHIKNRYKKFRTPPIPEDLISYLYDEQTPGLITTDVPDEQRERQFRPFELRKDAKGNSGLYEVENGNFYYNLETVTIEKRLSNGYYKRPKDFLADIKMLAKDAKTSRDEEKTIKANELVANVEIDLELIKDSNPALINACEQVYVREVEREKLQQQEIVISGLGSVPRLSNVPLSASKDTTQTTGPVILGEIVPGRGSLPGPPFLKSPTYSQLTNGHSPSQDQPHSNGDMDISGHDEDVHMVNSQEAQGGSIIDVHGNIHPSASGSQVQRAQHSAITTMATGSQPTDYHNDASTTTSGNKTSDKTKSDQSSGPRILSQSTNGVLIRDHPDFAAFDAAHSDASQLPDTQDLPNSSSQSQHSQAIPGAAMGPPLPRQAAPIPDLLNKQDIPVVAVPTPILNLNPTSVTRFLGEVVQKTTGCSIEQLEQINAALMDVIWRMRGEWDRMLVLDAVQNAFNETIQDIEHVQKIWSNSQESQDRARSLLQHSSHGSGGYLEPED